MPLRVSTTPSEKCMRHWYGELLMTMHEPPGPPTGVIGHVWWERASWEPNRLFRLLGLKPVYFALRFVGGAYEGPANTTKGGQWLQGYWAFSSRAKREVFINLAEKRENL